MNNILVIDNYDSFTYNLVQYLGELGADVIVRRNDEIGIEEALDLDPGGIVISPGPCTPKEAGISVDMARIFSGRRPLLGVCLGHQCIGAAFGARISGARELMHGKTSAIRHDGKGVYTGLPNPFTATRYHSLVVEEETLPEVLTITARSEDGTIMGIRHRDHPETEGVQFHPESILTGAGKDLLAKFLEAVAGGTRREDES